MIEPRMRGVAEVECIHRDVSGNVVSYEKTSRPVSYLKDGAGNPVDIKED